MSNEVTSKEQEIAQVKKQIEVLRNRMGKGAEIIETKFQAGEDTTELEALFDSIVARLEILEKKLDRLEGKKPTIVWVCFRGKR